MIRKLLLLVTISGSLNACNQAKREPFNERRIKGYTAIGYLWEKRGLEADSLSLFELFQELALAFESFFDIKSNSESYNEHIARLRSFVNLIQERLHNKKEVEEEYSYDFIPFQEAFGEVLTYDEFEEKIIQQTKNLSQFLEVVSKTNSKIKIAYAFRNLTKQLPEGFIDLISSKRTGSPISTFELWNILKYRLGID